MKDFIILKYSKINFSSRMKISERRISRPRQKKTESRSGENGM